MDPIQLPLPFDSLESPGDVVVEDPPSEVIYLLRLAAEYLHSLTRDEHSCNDDFIC